MIRAFAVLPLLFCFACKAGPEEVDARAFDAGAMEADAEADAGSPDTGMEDLDGGFDAEPLDAAAPDAEPEDAAADGGADAEPGDVEVDAGSEDGGPLQLVEDFTVPEDETFTCPGGVAVMPGLLVEHGTQCLGIDGSGCPDERGLPGPGSAECADPAHNPFIGAGQCVTDFFSCFDPAGACTNDGAGRFTWANGARQTIEVDGNGALIRSEFVASTSTIPCIVGLPETPGGTRVIYERR